MVTRGSFLLPGTTTLNLFFFPLSPASGILLFPVSRQHSVAAKDSAPSQSLYHCHSFLAAPGRFVWCLGDWRSQRLGVAIGDRGS